MQVKSKLNTHLKPLHPWNAVPQGRVEIPLQPLHDEEDGGSSVVFVVHHCATETDDARVLRDIPNKRNIEC